jgi:hypothetical protein
MSLRKKIFINNNKARLLKVMFGGFEFKFCKQ